VVTCDVVVPVLYEADVTHSRRSPLVHRFDYRATYWLVDFDALPHPRGLLGWCAGVRKQDHVDIRGFLEDRNIAAARVVMLSGARSLGYTFDPISVFWCFDEDDAQCAVVAEVHNTYGERHAYLLEFDCAGEAEVEKAMYVSPFNDTKGSYRIRVSPPASTVSVLVSLEREGEEPFVATLRGTRRPLTRTSALVSVLRHSSARTRILIQWEALRLWRRGLTVQPR
jgi:uncharacterized protein